MKIGMAMGKEMTFAIDRFKALCKQVRDEKLINGSARPELVRERNNAAAEAIALVKQIEEHFTARNRWPGDWKERLHKLHLGLEKWQKEEGSDRVYL
jgi:hypothetical protein